MEVATCTVDDLERLQVHRSLDCADQLDLRISWTKTPITALEVVAVDQQIEAGAGSELEQGDPAHT
jgi:hypothetical protein